MLHLMQIEYSKNPREIRIGHNIWSIVYFPTKVGFKKYTFLSLMRTNLIPDSYSLVMDSCSTHYLLVSIFCHWLELSLKKESNRLFRVQVCLLLQIESRCDAFVMVISSTIQMNEI